MKIGFLGAGTAAKTIANHVLAFEHQILLTNSRGTDTLGAGRGACCWGVGRDAPASG